MAKFTNSDICNSMDINELRIIKAVAEEGSVSRAAERLNCVQPNLTARTRKLEESLNVPSSTARAGELP